MESDLPFVELTVKRGRPDDEVTALLDAIHDALVDAFEMPDEDRFQVVNRVGENDLVYDLHYRGGPRSTAFMVLRITAGRERSIGVKRAFMQRVVQLLHERCGVDPEDVFILLDLVRMEDLSFGGGRNALD